MADIINLNAHRLKKSTECDIQYHNYILQLDKLELMEEMVKFQEERAATGHLTVDMMVRGKHLFKCLEESAETEEMRLLCRSYRRHLDHELAAHLSAAK